MNLVGRLVRNGNVGWFRSRSVRNAAVNSRAVAERETERNPPALAVTARNGSRQGARAALSAATPRQGPLVSPCHTWRQKDEPREALSRGSPLTDRSRSSATVVEARQIGLEP